MGEEITGSLCLAAEGRAGDTVEVFCGEELDEGGDVRYEMRCGCTCREVWTLADGVCRLEPYDYKGFRYAKIILSAGASVQEIALAVRHYPMNPDACTFACSDEALTRIFSVCKHAVRLGTQESNIDCPTREKGQYLGDAIGTAHAQVLLSGEGMRSVRKRISDWWTYHKRIVITGMFAAALAVYAAVSLGGEEKTQLLVGMLINQVREEAVMNRMEEELLGGIGGNPEAEEVYVDATLTMDAGELQEESVSDPDTQDSI